MDREPRCRSSVDSVQSQQHDEVGIEQESQRSVGDDAMCCQEHTLNAVRSEVWPDGDGGRR